MTARLTLPVLFFSLLGLVPASRGRAQEPTWSDTEAGADAEAGAEAGADTEAGAEAEADAEAGAEAGADAEAGSDAGSGAGVRAVGGAEAASTAERDAELESGAAAASARSSAPWRLDTFFPSWLRLSLQHRSRYERVFSPFVSGDVGDDQLYALRTLVRAELRFDPFRMAVELQDSRGYFGDDDTPITTGSVNPVELLQGWVGLHFEDVLTEGSRLDARLGRMTMDVGSRRLVARNRYRNTINAFDGFDLKWVNHDGFQLRAFAVLPVGRRPSDADALRDNAIEFDQESFDTVFWGAYAGFRPVRGDIVMDTYFFGLHDQAKHRELYTSGFSAVRAPRRGGLDFEFENVVQFGSSRLSQNGDEDLRHLAYFAHAVLGYTLDRPGAIRLLLQYDYATGDADPDDDQSQRFDTLYGARRWEFGPTGIYGAFARTNINSPGVRVEARPHRALSGFFGYRAFWLASGADAWKDAGVIDPSGSSGSFLGHQLELRLRVDALPGNVRVETGFAHVFGGDYRRDVPGANPGNPTVVYAQLVLTL